MVHQYLQERVAENVRLSELAELSGLSKFHLIRTFRAAVGMAPHVYQLELRIQWAKVLLSQGRRLVDVALQTGFADQSHMTRKFKQIVGLTPRAFQQLTASPRRSGSRVPTSRIGITTPQLL